MDTTGLSMGSVITRSQSPTRSDPGWDVLLVCLAAFILTSIGRIHELFPVLSPLMPALLTGALAIALALLDRSPARRTSGLPLSPTRYLLAMTVWMALAVPFALWRGGALSTFLDFAKIVVIYVVIVGAVRSTRDVERLAFMYFVAAVAFAAVVLTRFEPGEGGRLAKLYYYDANDFATLVVTALPIGLYFAIGSGSRWLRATAWGGLAALMVGFVWSGSRGGFLALLAVTSYVLLRYSSIAKRWRVSALVAIGLVAGVTATESYWSGMSTLLRPSEDYNLTSEEGRLHIWRRGLGYVVEHPVLGVGPGNFPTAEGRLSPLAARQDRGSGVKWTAPHNSYLQVGAELGIPGLVMFGAFLVGVFGALRRAVAGAAAARGRQLAQALTAALIGFSVGAFFLTLAYHEMLYVLAAIALGLYKITAAAEPAVAPMAGRGQSFEGIVPPARGSSFDPRPFPGH